ncbi:CDP-glycerol glycerophosphotransferase family protein [Streptosporangiaceae bacterium NEAU-GS5]|nr:CDP-glycerol glycerophosphotransferase family protein [Streptosporangiaceae bacterium NEAU-GS5]
MGGRLRVIAQLLISYPALIAAALLQRPLLFAVATLASYAAELGASPRARAMLAKVHLGPSFRFLMRETAVILLVQSRWLAAGLFAFHAMRALLSGLASHLDRLHNRMPVETRNLGPATEPPSWLLLGWRGDRVLYLDVLPVGLAITGALAGAPWLAVCGVLAALAVQAGAGLVLALDVRRSAPLTDRERLVGVANDQVVAYQPEVLLYFSGPASAAYQVNMWLPALERAPRRVLVVLRERDTLRAIGPTTLPVVCLPSGVDLMNFSGLATARVALYASNVGNNIHLLRDPRFRSVFIGHGDSDKEASFNPFTRVYDEVWVAGPAGRERYAKAGVRISEIVEVGRPQLAGIRAEGPGLETPSVLYAPTWEGWTDDLFHTSITTMGPALIEALTRLPVRILYRPHPLTGHRDPRARAAHRAILELLREGDLVADGPIHEAFNACDALISDVSSVVADFLASGKPYVVTNVAGLPEERFRERYPTASAAYLMSPGLDEMPMLLDLLADDPLAESRRVLGEHLIGPDRFAEAVDRACLLGEQVVEAGGGLGLGGLGEAGRARQEAGAP